MKLKTISKPARTYEDVVSYRDDSGDLVLHPKYFYTAWEDNKGVQCTGYLSKTTGVINAPISPKLNEDEYWGQVWEPEKYKLEDCIFSGDELTFILE